MSTSCTLCGSARENVFEATVLNQHRVEYYFCRSCGLLQTETPYWLEEAYNSAIADADTGLVLRNKAIARRLSAILYFLFDSDGTYTDAAGGYGMLTRLMRDIGFDFYWQDEYCENLLARGFESESVDWPMTAVTAFEVLEHVPDPLRYVEGILDRYGTRTLIFSTELFQGDPPDPEAWWYYTLSTGQHISFYQHETLRYLGEQLSLYLYSNRGIHVLTDRRINSRLFNFLTGKGSWPGSAWARFRMNSLTFSDHESILGMNSGDSQK